MQGRVFDASYWEPTGDDRRQLIVISHGFAGDRTSHVDQAEALAARGYTVIAPTHPDLGGLEAGDMALDPLVLRPRHLSLAIDEAESRAGRQFDQVVVVGHSIGGYTALRSAGVEATAEGLDHHCDNQPDDQILCSLGARDRIAEVAVEAAPDPRIDRLVLLAPGYGPVLSADSLEELSVPVLVVEAHDDAELPGTQVADLIEALPSSTQHQVVPGGHFIFLRACTDIEAETIPDVCGERTGEHRDQVYEDIVAAVDTFAAAEDS